MGICRKCHKEGEGKEYEMSLYARVVEERQHEVVIRTLVEGWSGKVFICRDCIGKKLGDECIGAGCSMAIAFFAGLSGLLLGSLFFLSVFYDSSPVVSGIVGGALLLVAGGFVLRSGIYLTIAFVNRLRFRFGKLPPKKEQKVAEEMFSRGPTPVETD